MASATSRTRLHSLIAATLSLVPAETGLGQAVLMEPEMALAAERIFLTVDTELVFCLRAHRTPSGGWRVGTIELAPQGTGAHRDGANFSCGGAEGFMHNHPRQGDRWCRLSHQDRKTLERYEFAILWCPSRRFTYKIRGRPGTAVLPP